MPTTPFPDWSQEHATAALFGRVWNEEVQLMLEPDQHALEHFTEFVPGDTIGHFFDIPNLFPEGAENRIVKVMQRSVVLFEKHPGDDPENPAGHEIRAANLGEIYLLNEDGETYRRHNIIPTYNKSSCLRPESGKFENINHLNPLQFHERSGIISREFNGGGVVNIRIGDTPHGSIGYFRHGSYNRNYNRALYPDGHRDSPALNISQFFVRRTFGQWAHPVMVTPLAAMTRMRYVYIWN